MWHALQGAPGPREGLRPPVHHGSHAVEHLFLCLSADAGLEEDAVPRLNLEHHRKRARALLNSARASQPGAALHEAQLVVARESGFPSWTRLKAHIRAESLRRPMALAGLLVAANRAEEANQPRPLYRDPLARHLAGEEGRALLAALREATWPGFASGPDRISRSDQYFDDALRHVVRRARVTQVVVVHAGTDTRAFRLGWPPATTVFEVDDEDVFAHKQSVLDSLRARPRCRRETVTTGRDGGLRRALLRRGFDPARRSAFLIERLQFMEAAAVTRLLREDRALSSPGSWLGLSVISEEMRIAPVMAPFLRRMEDLGFPRWCFGVDDPESWLAAHGWRATSVVAGAPEASFGRWPYGYVPRGMPAVFRGFLTQAWVGVEEQP